MLARPIMRFRCVKYKPSRDVGFGSSPFGAGQSRTERFFAFALAEGSVPRVFSYEDGEDGVEKLANLIRSEDVLKIVKGREVRISSASVVSFDIGGRRTEHKLEVC